MSGRPQLYYNGASSTVVTVNTMTPIELAVQRILAHTADQKARAELARLALQLAEARQGDFLHAWIQREQRAA